MVPNRSPSLFIDRSFPARTAGLCVNEQRSPAPLATSHPKLLALALRKCQELSNRDDVKQLRPHLFSFFDRAPRNTISLRQAFVREAPPNRFWAGPFV